MTQAELKVQDRKFVGVMKSLLTLMLKKYNHKISIKIALGGGSYTDGKMIAVGTPEYTISDLNPRITKLHEEFKKKMGLDFSPSEVWMLRQALFLHETSHILYSDFGEFKKFREWGVKEFAYLKAKIDPKHHKTFDMVVEKVMASINNCVEDGRAENFLVNNFPGAGKYLQYLNLAYYKYYDEVPSSELRALELSICTLATSGLYPLYFDKLKKDVKDGVESVEKDIFRIVKTASAYVARRNLEKVVKKLKPVIERILLDEIENAAMMQELMELLKDVDFSNLSPLDDEQEDLDENALTIHIPMPGKGKGKGKGSPSPSEKSDENEDGSGEGEGEDNDSDKKDSEDGEGEGSKGEDSKEGKDKDGKGSSDGDNKDDKKEKDDKGKGKGKDKKDGEEKADGKGKDKKKDKDYSSEGKKGEAEKTEGSKSDSNSDEPEDNNSAGFGDESSSEPDGSTEAVTKGKQSLIDDINETLKELGNKGAKEMVAAVKKEEAALPTSENISESAKDRVEQSYKSERIHGFEAVDVDVSLITPPEIVTRGRLLRKKLERYFAQQAAIDLTNQHSGRLNVSKIRRVAANDFRIFEKKGNPTTSDTAIYVVWDGSGSMCGDKQRHSTIACAILEEALKDLVPLKIINFTVPDNYVCHYIVKGFNQNDKKKNYAYSYGASRSFTGGNKDGYSIRIAYEEIRVRPEQKKIIIVLSDGLPSDYNSDNIARNDVKDAVAVARKNGVGVIPIFFGDSHFRASTQAEYVYMYEKNLISASPDELPAKLESEIKKVLMGR